MDQLPHERIIYVGDTAHGPYGPLKIAEVRANALRIMDELVDSGVKMLVIACNTASAAVLRDARERYTRHYGIPVIEVIQPAARRALAATRTRQIGAIAPELPTQTIDRPAIGDPHIGQVKPEAEANVIAA